MAVLQVTSQDGLTSYPFEPFEVPQVKARRLQPSVTQSSLTGNLSVLYIGEPRYEFEISFSISRGGDQGTLEKLDAIYGWRQPFRLYPFYRNDLTTYFNVIWPGDIPFEEVLLFGYPQARHLMELTWLEARETACTGDDDFDNPGKGVLS